MQKLTELYDLISPAIASSIVLIVGALLLRQLIIRFIRTRTTFEDSDKRRWTTTTRNAILGFVIVALVFVWLPQLSAFALSITAFAVAVVLATKELILCVSGMIMRISTRPFDVGDWIEVDGLRGEVIDEGTLGFMLQELDPSGRTNDFTGRTVTIPNSRLLSSHVFNEHFRRRYVFHHFRFTFDRAVDPDEPARITRRVLDERSGQFAEVAARYWSRIRNASDVEIPGIESTVAVRTTDIGHTALDIRVFCPSRESERIETAVNHALATWAISSNGEASVP